MQRARHLIRLALPVVLLLLPLFVAAVHSQQPGEAGRRTINQSAEPLLAPFRFRSIGPASMGGRVDDIAVSEVAWLNDQQHGQHVGGQKLFVAENAPRGTAIHYYLKTTSPAEVRITIADITGKVVRSMEGTTHAGLNRVLWNLAPNPPAGAAARRRRWSRAAMR